MIGRRVAAAILAREEEANPAVVELATLLSLSSRIEPELLRAVRLAAAPQLHAGAEGDLWFSPLVASRGPDGITFHPEVTEVLRRRLRDRVKRETVEQAWRVTQRLHRDLSPALALEEKVAWHAIVDASASTQAIEDELSRALVALIEEARPGVARWVAQAWPRLPAEARRTRIAWQLKEAAAPYLGAYRIRADETPEKLDEVDLRATVERLPDVRMPVRRVGRLIQLGRVKPDRAVAIRVPDTDPRLIELRWTEADRGHTELVQVQPGSTAHHPVGFGPVELRTLRGALYQLPGRRPVAIFLASTPSDGEALAGQLASELLGQGFRLERLPDRSQPVAGFRGITEASLNAVDLLVLLLTPDALRSQVLQAAWQGALARGKPILSAMMGIVADELPEQLRSLQPLDLHELDLDGAVARLLAAIDTIIEALPEDKQERMLTERGDVADFVKYQLDDGSEVFFESAEASLVSLRGGQADVVDAGRLGDRLSNIAAAADQVSRGLRERLAPDEIELEFGVKISGEVDWWFFAKTSGEASINVTLTWRKSAEVPLSPPSAS